MTEATVATRATERSLGLPGLLYTDDQDALRASVRQLLVDRSPWQQVVSRTERAETTDTGLWRALTTDLGLAGLAIAEDKGGAGATWAEAAVVMEELGRACAAVPFLGSTVLATGLADDLDARDLLAGLVAGTRTAALAVPFASRDGSSRDGSRVALVAGCVDGTVHHVADVLVADTLLVPVATGQIVVVSSTDPGVTVDPVVSLDMTRQLATVTFVAAVAEPIADGQRARSALEHAYVLGAALLASEQLGVAQWCLEATVDHLKQRQQFGRLLGSYQALKHRCADLWVQISQARAAARYAAACASSRSTDLPIAASLAQSWCSSVAVHVAEECVQMHGGIGFTWEFPVHLYLKRAMASYLALGSPDEHRSRLATLVDLPAPATAVFLPTSDSGVRP